MTSQADQQIITRHILPNISRSKDNQSVKVGQLIEHKVRNIFLEKSCIKYGGEPNPRVFCENSKLSISLGQQLEMLQGLFLLYVQVEVYKIY